MLVKGYTDARPACFLVRLCPCALMFDLLQCHRHERCSLNTTNPQTFCRANLQQRPIDEDDVLDIMRDRH